MGRNIERADDIHMQDLEALRTDDVLVRSGLTDAPLGSVAVFARGDKLVDISMHAWPETRHT